MQTIQHFFNSLSVEQIALAIGSITFLLHSVLNRNDKLAKPLNLFLVRATSVIVPVLTALALDPNVSGLVHNYFPALLGFFTAYQGLYHLGKAIDAKLQNLKELTAPKPIQTGEASQVL
jgi:hypothetical protein